MAFYKPGEQKRRPGVYIRIVNRGADAVGVLTVTPVEPDPSPPIEIDGFTVLYDSSGAVALYIPGCTVTDDGNGTVTLSGLTSAAYDDNGKVTIGG